MLKKEQKKEEKEMMKELKNIEKQNKVSCRSLNDYDSQFFAMINDYRMKFGKPPLKLVYDPLCKIEKDHIKFMINEGNQINHYKFNDRINDIPNAILLLEIIVYSRIKNDVATMFYSLVSDPIQRINILGQYNSIGIAVVCEGNKWFVSILLAYIKDKVNISYFEKKFGIDIEAYKKQII